MGHAIYTEHWAIERGAPARLDLPDDVPGTFPVEAVLVDVVREVTGVTEPRFAIIQTDYFDGAGSQWAVVSAARPG